MEKKKETKIWASCFSFSQYIWPLSRCIQNLKTLALIEADKFVTDWREILNLIGEKEKWTTKGNDKRKRLILFHTIQQVVGKIYIKFQNPRHNSSWEIFDAHFPMYYIGVRDGKMEKEGKNKSQNLGFLSRNILDHSQGVHKIWRLWLS